MSKRFILAVFVISTMILLRLSNIQSLIDLEYIFGQRDMLLDYVSINMITSMIVYMLVYIFVVGFGVPGSAAMSIIGGLLFGFAKGSMVAFIGAVSGATLNFFFARYVLGDYLQKKYEVRLKKFNDDLKRNGKYYLLSIRFIPIFPFFLINLFAGLSTVPYSRFLWTTLVGILPGGVFFIYAGTTLRVSNTLTDAIAWRNTVPLFLLGLIALLPVIWNRRKVHEK